MYKEVWANKKFTFNILKCHGFAHSLALFSIKGPCTWCSASVNDASCTQGIHTTVSVGVFGVIKDRPGSKATKTF